MAAIGDIPDSIYLLQEPYFNTKGRPGVRKPSQLFYSKSDARAAIYVSSLQSFKFVPMPQFTERDISVGIIEGGCLDSSTIIASIYLDRKYDPTILPAMKELVDFCIMKQKRLICGIDCNAHSPLWGSPDTNKRGEKLEDFLFHKNLFVHNVGHEPTWRGLGGKGSSIIDITISLNVGDDIQGWHVSRKTTFSDHKMVCFALDTIQSQKILSRNYSRAKWPDFRKYISSHLKEHPQLVSETIVEENLAHLYDIIEEAQNIACPKQRVRKRDSLVWWNQECENVRRHYIAVERKVKRKQQFSVEERHCIKAARRSYKYAIRRAKRDSFRELVRDTTSVHAMAKLNKILDRKESNSLGLITKADGTTTVSTGETLQVMTQEHFPGSEQCSDPDVRSNLEGDPRPVDSLGWITNQRIRLAFQQFEPFKAAGPDGLRPIVIQNLPEEAITFLRHVYTACIQMGFTPQMWCHSKVLYLPKPGKKSYNLPRSYRPISLTAGFFKGLERLVVWRLEEATLIERPLHKRQFAFRKNISTENALTASQNVIEKSLYRNRMVIVLDLDIKGAFDNVSTEAIIRSLEKRKVEEHIISWYNDYLCNRTCEAELGGSKIFAKLTRGGPQGGVATPVIAWCFPYDDLLESYDGSEVDSFGFADDGRLIITGIDFDTMLRSAQWALDVAVNWADKAGVSFSPEKTTAMFLNQGLFQPLAETRPGGGSQPLVETRLKLYGKELKWEKETKYLGVIVDNRLTFKSHIEAKIAAAKRKLMILRQVFSNSWGPSPKAIRWAYTGIVRPALTYGAIAWASSITSQNTINDLSRLQRLALLQVAPVRKSTPQAALELLYNVMPLHLYIKEQALKSAFRIGIKPNWFPTGKRGHQHTLYNELPTFVQGKIVDDLQKVNMWEQNYKVTISNGNDIPLRVWSCYTDGSKVGKGAGSGGPILHMGKEVEKVSFSVGESSVFQAELSAILACAKILISKGLTGTYIDFRVDSQAALRSLDTPFTESDLVRRTKSSLNIIGSSNKLELRWVRAHRGWKFNEVADMYANEGREQEEIPDNIPSPSKRVMFAAIEKAMRDKWEELWDKEPGCRQSRFFIMGPCKSKARKLILNSRLVLGRLVRFLTGHAFLRRQNAVVFHGHSPPPGDISCRMCEDPDKDETPHHLITECEALCHWRISTLGSFLLQEVPVWDPDTLAKFINNKNIILLETDDPEVSDTV